MGAMHILNNYMQLRVRQTIMPLLHLFAVGDAQPTEARRFVDLRTLVFIHSSVSHCRFMTLVQWCSFRVLEPSSAL